MCGTVMRGADALPGSKATSRAKGSHRNLGGLGSGRQMLRERDGPHREGEEPKPMMHGHEKSDLVIVAVKPTNKARKALCGGVCGGGRSGVSGAKGGGQGQTRRSHPAQPASGRIDDAQARRPMGCRRPQRRHHGRRPAGQGTRTRNPHARAAQAALASLRSPELKSHRSRGPGHRAAAGRAPGPTLAGRQARQRRSLRVEQAVEQTTRGGIVIKAPKTRHGRRAVSLAPATVAVLREHWTAQQEARLALGLGKAPPTATCSRTGTAQSAPRTG